MKSRIDTLDGLRGIAILLVLAGHTVANLQPLGWLETPWIRALANPGGGVRLFFVLSGYLITHLLLQEQAATGSIGLLQFYRRRALRIWPAFYAYLLTLVLLALWFPTGLNVGTFTAAATFTWNYASFWAVPPPEGTWNLGHLWTLALEQQFYLLWPLALIVFPRRALWIAVALVIWCPLARVGTYYLFPAQRGLLAMMFHTGIDSLMAGCAAALLLQSAAWRERLLRCGRLAGSAALWLLVLSPLAALHVRGFGVSAGFTLDAAAAALLIAWMHRAPPAWAQALLGRGPLRMLGLISYSLYLWQQLFLSPDGWLAQGRLLAPLLAALAAAVLSYRLVEKPLLGLKDRRHRSPPLPGLPAKTA
ncbi:acyltransferase family protein [Opitutus terrae]|uniref:Acyltransferase 3 n=1 Tax=Opitutus terrae (strain DSM 11246 / JCM 15787 / PB90-1) TaxID=452637 RepID=B1ZW21_OPITP|nr:acyltransferase [Opitutus terrae]ACB76035.1 acyltransferase 3 [Opitutus terrae PB90-1]